MAKDGNISKIVGSGAFVVLVVGGLIGWGGLKAEHKTAKKDIQENKEKKLDKEIFQMHAQQQVEVLTEMRADFKEDVKGIETSIKEQRIEQRADMKELKELFRNGP